MSFSGRQSLDLADPQVDPFAVAAAAAEVIAGVVGAPRHDVALVLGSGWGQSADLIGRTVATIDNADVPGFAAATVAGHAGVIRSVNIGDTDRRALVFGARTHYYEGRGVRPVAHAVRTASAAGCRTVVLTNGCGSLRPAWAPGTPVLIRDHLNLTAASPIEGADFVDLTDLYSPRLRRVTSDIDPTLPEGVYVQFRGPHYETPAEVQMAKILGGDLVGMSTSLEAIAARQCGLEVLGISLVTNLAAGISTQPLSHHDVLEAGRLASERCGRLLAAVVAAITALAGEADGTGRADGASGADGTGGADEADGEVDAHRADGAGHGEGAGGWADGAGNRADDADAAGGAGAQR